MPAKVCLKTLTAVILILSVFTIYVHGDTRDSIEILNDLNRWIENVYEIGKSSGYPKMPQSLRNDYAILKASLSHWHCQISNVVNSMENCRYIEEDDRYSGEQYRKSVEEVSDALRDIARRLSSQGTIKKEAKAISARLRSHAFFAGYSPWGRNSIGGLSHQRKIMKIKNKEDIKSAKKECKERVRESLPHLIEGLNLLERADEALYKILITAN